MRCCIKALTRSLGALSLKGEGQAWPSPFRGKVAGGRMRVLILVVTFTLLNSLAIACPFCKDSLSQAMAKGFYWSILWMLTVPAVVVGVIAGVLWRAAQKRRGAPAGPHE